MPPVSENEYNLMQTLTTLRTNYLSYLNSIKGNQNDLVSYEARVASEKKRILDLGNCLDETLKKIDETRKLLLAAVSANNDQLPLNTQEPSTEQLGRSV